MKYGHELQPSGSERTGVQKVRLAAFWYDAERRKYVPFSGLTVIGRMRVKRLREVMEEAGKIMAETERAEG